MKFKKKINAKIYQAILVTILAILVILGIILGKKEIKTSYKEDLKEMQIATRGSRIEITNQIELSKISERKKEKQETTNKVEIAKTTSRASTETRKSSKNEKSNNKSDTKKENKEKTTSIKDVKISKNMDLTKRTGLSRKDFIKLISGVKQDTSGFFEENAGTIYDLCKEYNINEIFFCGLISAESGWNIASNHRTTHNYISLMKNGKLIKYSSVKEGLEVAAQKLHNNYLTPGGKFYHGKTLTAVKTNFCPSSSTWVDLVYGRMKQIIK